MERQAARIALPRFSPDRRRVLPCSLGRIIAVVLVITAPAPGENITFGTADNTFEVEFIEIANPGNPMDDVVFTDGVGGSFPVGKVDYVYELAKYEISRDIVRKATNEGSLAIKLSSMDRIDGGPRPDMPATGIQWIEAARFVNWLNVHQGYPEAYKLKGPTGFSLWDPDDEGYDPGNLFRNALAKFVLPSAHEWHKAAFYDPGLNEGTASYWDYPIGSDSEPQPIPSGVQPGTMVYKQPRAAGPADVTRAGGLSPYGIMALGGNVEEWEETARDFTNDSQFRDEFGIRGGRWVDKDWGVFVLSNYRGGEPIGEEFDSLGFRVVMLPDSETGDFNRDGAVTADDMDLLSQRARTTSSSALFDLNKDFDVNQMDREIWVSQVANTHFGDADLNGTVEFDDFLLLSNAFNQATGWSGGDFDGNGVTEFADFLILSHNFGGTRDPELATVPEPASLALLVSFWLGLGVIRRPPRIVQRSSRN